MASTTGRCLCGAARYRLSEAPTGFGACHCGMCRRWTGGIELGVMVAADAIVWEADETMRTYRSSDWAERGFCATCGTSLFWRLTAPGPMQGMLSLGVGTLDDAEGLSFEMELCVDSKPESYAFAGDRTRMTAAEVAAMMSDAGGSA
jgi:Uncharacterized conserved protein